MPEKLLFEEKQYLGYNKFSIIRRLLIATFCFVAYYWSQNPKPVDISGIRIGSYPVKIIPNSGELFFLLGIIILLISAVMIFLLHLHIKVDNGQLIVSGLWTSRTTVIPLTSIVKLKKIRYGNLNLKPAAFNLHIQGKIRFYTFGKEAIEIVDNQGVVYRLGTQRANELFGLLNSALQLPRNNL